MIVIKVSKTGGNLTNSKLCEKCVLMVNKLSIKTGIKINKIYYSLNNDTMIKTNIENLINSEDQHISSYFKNSGYKSHLIDCDCCDEDDEEDDDEDG